MTLKISQLTPVAAGSLDGSEPVELGIAGDKNAPNGAFLPPGYIDGLQMQWVSATAVTVSSGAAYIESLGRVLRSPNAIALTGLVLAASTFYHLYLYDNAGTPAIECVTTAPDAPYNGTARAKTGDTSRRYIGSVLTDASGNVYQFRQAGQVISYLYNLVSGIPTFRILGGGTATTPTVFSAASSVPVTSTLPILRMSNTDSAVQWGLSSGDYPQAAFGDGQFGVASLAKLFSFVSTDSSQQLKYCWNSAPTGAAYVDVIGYLYER